MQGTKGWSPIGTYTTPRGDIGIRHPDSEVLDMIIKGYDPAIPEVDLTWEIAKGLYALRTGPA